MSGGLAGFFKALTGPGITDVEVRAEAWALGGRHRGDVMAGAKAELLADGLSPRQAGLLRAVIRRQEREATRP